MLQSESGISLLRSLGHRLAIETKLDPAEDIIAVLDVKVDAVGDERTLSGKDRAGREQGRREDCELHD